MATNYFSNIANIVCLFWFNEYSLLNSAFQNAQTAGLARFTARQSVQTLTPPASPLVTTDPLSKSHSGQILSHSNPASTLIFSKYSLPTPQFRSFIINLIRHTQLPVSAISLALLYILRLKQLSPRPIIGNPNSESRVFTVALMLANKFLDDNTYTNKTWADVSRLPLEDISTMEIEFLANMRYSLVVSAAEWSAWQSHLQTWLAVHICWCKPPFCTGSGALTELVQPVLPTLVPLNQQLVQAQAYQLNNEPLPVSNPLKRSASDPYLELNPLPDRFDPNTPIPINNGCSGPPAKKMVLESTFQLQQTRQNQSLPPLIFPISKSTPPATMTMLSNAQASHARSFSNPIPAPYNTISATRLSSSPYAPVFPIRTLIIPTNTASLYSSSVPSRSQQIMQYNYPLYRRPSHSRSFSQNAISPVKPPASSNSSPWRFASAQHSPAPNVPLYYYSITDYKSSINPTPHCGLYTQGIPNIQPPLTHLPTHHRSSSLSSISPLVSWPSFKSNSPSPLHPSSSQPTNTHIPFSAQPTPLSTTFYASPSAQDQQASSHIDLAPALPLSTQPSSVQHVSLVAPLLPLKHTKTPSQHNLSGPLSGPTTVRNRLGEAASLNQLDDSIQPAAKPPLPDFKYPQ